jgi:hypothetical protein
LAADVDEAVDRGGTADHFASCVVDGASVGAGVRLGAVFPGQGVVVEHFEEAGGDVDQRVTVTAAGLDEDDVDRGVLGEAVGEDATGGAGTDDDIVCLHVRSPRGGGCGYRLAGC